jgi:hypothetical protein
MINDAHECACHCGQPPQVRTDLEVVDATVLLLTGLCGDRLRASSAFHLRQGIRSFVEPVGLKMVVEHDYGIASKIDVNTFPSDTEIVATRRS